MNYPVMKDVVIQKPVENLSRYMYHNRSADAATVERYKMHVWDRWNARVSKFAIDAEGCGATLFQSELWLATWYETFTARGNADAVIIGIEDRVSGNLVMVLPLCRVMENGLETICFADFGLADYNAPLLHPEFDPDRFGADKLMTAICKVLPAADLLKFEKMPAQINGKKNPLISHPSAHKSNLCHYGIEVPKSWNEYWTSLKRSFRKDQRRRWRVLHKKGEVSFVWCKNAREVDSLFAILTRQQRRRLDGLGLPYLLADPDMKDFYRQIIRNGCTDGPVIFTALLVDDKPVATLCGFGDGTRYAMTISGYESEEWSKCSPGRLLTERTMQILHKQGYSYFDFTIGDEPYKKYFAKENGPLHELVHTLSWKALPRYAWLKTKALQRQSPHITRLKQFLAARSAVH
jgi:CelD/BcsL family acetyltransferase involved in cellulose biosynthesis